MTGPASFRYWVRSPEGRAIFGFTRLEAASVAALDMPLGSHLIDTMAQAYFPLVQEVRPGSGGDKELFYLPYGGWDTGRFGLDRDLIEGIKKGHVAIVHAFLAKGANANARDSQGGTALHWAAASGNRDIVQFLLRNGADAVAADGNRRTAAAVARGKGRSEIADLIEAARR